MNRKLVLVNAITATRLISAPLVVWLVYNQRWGIATPLLLIGFVTDLADGKLARKWEVTTRFGYILDAQSDRLLLASPVLGMALAGELPWWYAGPLIAGVWISDLVANSFGLMRVVWWPLKYLTIGWGVWTHSAPGFRGLYIGTFVVLAGVVLYIKREEVKKIKLW